jgi:hypothetical protein
MFWKKKLKASDHIAKFIEGHVKTWTTTIAIDKMLDGGIAAPLSSVEHDKLILSASIYGAADSFGQSIGATTADTAAGIELHLKPYSDREDMYREIIIAGTMPEMSDVVSWTGQAIHRIRANGADVTSEYMTLIGLIKSKYQAS